MVRAVDVPANVICPSTSAVPFRSEKGQQKLPESRTSMTARRGAGIGPDSCVLDCERTRVERRSRVIRGRVAMLSIALEAVLVPERVGTALAQKPGKLPLHVDTKWLDNHWKTLVLCMSRVRSWLAAPNVAPG